MRICFWYESERLYEYEYEYEYSIVLVAQSYSTEVCTVKYRN